MEQFLIAPRDDLVPKGKDRSWFPSPLNNILSSGGFPTRALLLGEIPAAGGHDAQERAGGGSPRHRSIKVSDTCNGTAVTDDKSCGRREPKEQAVPHRPDVPISE
ncbi:hypothetical protein Y1Q_0008083 [Alligator mississippiensis]|uniref:Uncharacterized protein n=1 Tax=Alligator mississippiensis TaxID=8496 RepID=A0A151NFH5_ALLMI|nr:hypothetical protein Y1Q_0008083 [Alligator mississippiensis]